MVGLQMRYDKFYELFMGSTRVCPNKHGPCNLTCESDVSFRKRILRDPGPHGVYRRCLWVDPQGSAS